MSIPLQSKLGGFAEDVAATSCENNSIQVFELS